MAFIIQYKSVATVRGGIGDQVLMKVEEGWCQTNMEFDTFEKAKAYALRLIDLRTYSADSIRVLEVVCTFESEIKVKENVKNAYKSKS